MDDYKNGLLSESIVYCTALYMAAQNGHRDVVKFISELPIKPIGSHLFKYTAFYFAAQNGHMSVLEAFARNGINFVDDLVDGTTKDFECTDEQATLLIQDSLKSSDDFQIDHIVNPPVEVNNGNIGTPDLSLQDFINTCKHEKLVSLQKCSNITSCANNIDKENAETNFVNTVVTVEEESSNDEISCGDKALMNISQKIQEIKSNNTDCDVSKAVIKAENIEQINETSINDQIATTMTSKIYLHTDDTDQNKTIEDKQNVPNNNPGEAALEAHLVSVSPQSTRNSPMVSHCGRLETTTSNTNYIAVEEKCENIFDAVKKGTIEQVKTFLDKCLDVDAADENNNALLHFAAARGDIDVLNIVLDAGAKLKPKNKFGNTPIHLACEHGNLQVVNELHERRVNIGIVNPLGDAPIHLAAKHNHLELLKLLLDKGASINQKNKNDETCLHIAVQNGHESMVELLLCRKYKRIIDLNAQIKSDGNTALILAVQIGSQSIINLLLASNVNVNIRNHENNVAVFYTADVTIVELLCKHGLDLNLESGKSETILYYAAKCNYIHIVDFLLKKQRINLNYISADYYNSYNETALYTAASHGHFDIVELLLNYNAKFETKSRRIYQMYGNIHYNNFNPLHVATYNGHFNVVEILLENGMDVNECIWSYNHCFKLSPLTIAAIKGHTKIAELLLMYGANKQLSNDISKKYYNSEVKILIENYQSMY